MTIHTIAIFKASYTRSTGAAKGNIRYIQNRRGKDGEKIIRTLYTWDGKIDRRDAYELIDEATTGSYFFRLIISPDPVKEDTNRDIYLRTLTEQTMRGLEDRMGTQIHWIAANHQDHAPQRHMHVLAILPRKLTRDDLFAGRTLACPVLGKIDTTIRGHKELFGADAPARIVWESAVPVLHEDETCCRN